jgi:hypothetical protein
MHCRRAGNKQRCTRIRRRGSRRGPGPPPPGPLVPRSSFLVPRSSFLVPRGEGENCIRGWAEGSARGARPHRVRKPRPPPPKNWGRLVLGKPGACTHLPITSNPPVRAGGLRVLVAANSFALRRLRPLTLPARGRAPTGLVNLAHLPQKTLGEVDVRQARGVHSPPHHLKSSSPRRRTSCACCGEFIRSARRCARYPPGAGGQPCRCTV